MTEREPLEVCPACGLRRVDAGPCSSAQFAHGAWIGCTACGLSLCGPDGAILEAAWRSICRSTAVKDLRQAPQEPEDPSCW